VILVPTGDAPHKRIDPEPGAEVRLELAQASVEGEQLLEVSDLEVRRDGPSYTYLTLEQLRDLHPGDDLVFLAGADSVSDFERWEQPRRVLELGRLGVAARPGASLEEVEAALDRLGAGGQMDVIEMPPVDVSSTAVRERVAEGQALTGLVPGAVASLIEERGLYREAVRA